MGFNPSNDVCNTQSVLPMNVLILHYSPQLFASLFQLRWSGHYITGTGLSTGETTELANSYMSRLGLTTRHMTQAGM
jgi:hypothetical protein